MEDGQMNAESVNDEEYEEDLVGEEEELESLEENSKIIKYNANDFKIEDIIKKLQDLKILKNNFICSSCHCNMIYCSNNKYMDGYIWRCKKTNDNNHDIKVNIRKNSFIENIKAELRMVYFIIFFFFKLFYI